MFCIAGDNFEKAEFPLGRQLLSVGNGGGVVKVPEWQSVDVSNKPQGQTVEVQNAVMTCPIPEDIASAISDVEPNIPWAEEHFLERVSGVPHNPPPSHVNWPYAQANNKEHTKDGKFSHTYPERFWPKGIWELKYGEGTGYLQGVRFEYGDLSDVVLQLIKSPHTRQAYLPVWFPEDTGAVHGERVPCTLGYHFLIREGKLNVTYFIRSCDFVRHFRDDVYLAMRLGQWVRDQTAVSSHGEIESYKMGTLTMHMVSLHCFEADLPKLRREYGAHW